MVSETTNFNQSAVMIELEYNSVIRKTRINDYLSCQRINKFVNEGVDELAFLEKVYRLITNLLSQVPTSCRDDAYKEEFLRSAIVRHAWATELLNRVNTHELVFQLLYGKLKDSLHLERHA